MAEAVSLKLKRYTKFPSIHIKGFITTKPAKLRRGTMAAQGPEAGLRAVIPRPQLPLAASPAPAPHIAVRLSAARLRWREQPTGMRPTCGPGRAQMAHTVQRRCAGTQAGPTLPPMRMQGGMQRGGIHRRCSAACFPPRVSSARDEVRRWGALGCSPVPRPADVVPGDRSRSTGRGRFGCPG